MSRAIQTKHQLSLPAEPRVAVLLNGNARRVKPALKERLAKYIDPEHIYYSRTLEEAEQIAHSVYDKEYDLVFTAGGDGTFLHSLTQLQKHYTADGGKKALPAMGILPFGTGNAVASVLGSRRQCGPDLLRAQHGKGIKLRSHRWVEVNGQLAPFAGMGCDSLILNNFKKLNQRTAKGPFAFMGRGGIGYAIAIAFMSIPRIMFQKKTNITVINEGEVAYQLDAEGNYAQQFEKGQVIYEGPALIQAASTVPCYGFKFNLFPFAASGQHMQLRVANTSVLETLANLPAIWRGSYRSPKILDFHASKMRVLTEDPQPLQIGGDAAGYHNEVVYQLSEQATSLVDFTKTKNLPVFQSPHYQLPIR